MDNTIYNLVVDTAGGYTPSTTYPINDNWYWGKDTSWGNWTISYPNTIYMYQIQCPKLKCKKMNWLKLDTITPCTGCGAKLKAVSEQAEYEIAVS